MNIVLALTMLIITLGFPVASAAQEPPRAMYTYSVFNAKPLPVGAPVWANFGDCPCAYPRTGDPPVESNYPLTSDFCFEKEYLKAKILMVYREKWWDGRWYYLYRVAFEARAVDDLIIWRDARLDDALEIYNLPEKWASHSRYFIRLNW